MKRYSDIPNAPKAVGPYSAATEANGFVFLAGQIGFDPATSALAEGGIKGQTEQTLKNIKNILTHLGLTFDNVVKTTIFLANMSDYDAVNSIYGEAIGESRPARSTFQVAGLPRNALIEIEMIAARE